MVLKEKEIYNKLIEESFEKISNLDKKVDTNKLVFKISNLDKKVDTNKLAFKYKGKTTSEDFSNFDNTLDLIDKIRDGKISLNEAKDKQDEDQNWEK